MAARIPAAEDVPVDAIPAAVLGLGVLQARIAAVQSGLSARALLSASRAAHSDTEARWFSVDEVAELMGVSTSWLYKRWRSALPFGFRFGGKLVFPSAKVNAFLRSASPPPSSTPPGAVLSWPHRRTSDRKKESA